jgi:hypothetical protein
MMCERSASELISLRARAPAFPAQPLTPSISAGRVIPPPDARRRSLCSICCQRCARAIALTSALSTRGRGRWAVPSEGCPRPVPAFRLWHRFAVARNLSGRPREPQHSRTAEGGSADFPGFRCVMGEGPFQQGIRQRTFVSSTRMRFIQLVATVSGSRRTARPTLHPQT